jgi:hypothetical protein
MNEAKRVSSKLVISIDTAENPLESRLFEVKTLCQNIKTSIADPFFSGFLHKKSESLSLDLEKILSGEKKLQKLCEAQIKDLRNIADKRIQVFNSLNKKRNKVSELCDLYESMQLKLDGFTREIDEKGQKFKGNNQLSSIKSSLKQLKDELKLLTNKEALARYQLDMHKTIN